MEEYHEDIKKVEMSLKVVKPGAVENREAGITVLVPNNDFRASRICDMFEEAIDLYVEALKKQLAKYREE